MKTLTNGIQDQQDNEQLVLGAVAGAYIEATVNQINELNAKLLKNRLKVTPLFAAGLNTDGEKVYLCCIENNVSVFTLQ